MKVTLPKMEVWRAMLSHERLKLKICAVPGCCAEFYGSPLRKYCDLHRNPRNRPKTKRELEPITAKNQIFPHHFFHATQVSFKCALDGCENLFPVTVYPRIFVYPKYCPEHRTIHRREHFARMHGGQK